MARNVQLLDRWGNPVQRRGLDREIATPTLAGVRSPLSGYPGDGLNPLRLAEILRAADHGDAIRFLELAETIEERDPHYLGVLSTRKRSVAQIDISVDAASDLPADIQMADMVRDWLTRDELTSELFNILDCIGKGVSFTEIAWEVSEGQWRPAALKRRDPRWFRFDRIDLETPRMLDDHGREVPLAPYRFIYANIVAKSGLPLRSGLARVAAWGWMFKAFTQRDWAIFTQTYGQPLRVGKWHTGASDQEKAILFRAVANIAGDMAAIIPANMEMEFIESKSIGASSDLYERRADWIDRQISKAVLGQTATTDAIAGGHAVGREHRQVQEDIETADARALSAILNRDLIRPWINLEFGPQKTYPRLRIARPDNEDVKALSEVVARLVPLGMRVEESQIRDRLGLADPAPDAPLLAPAPQLGAFAPHPAEFAASLNGQSGVFKRGLSAPGITSAPQAEQAVGGVSGDVDPVALLADRMDNEAAPAMAAMVEQIEAMLEAASSLEEFREMLTAAYPQLDGAQMAAALGTGFLAAELGGRAVVESEADGA